MSFIGTCGGRAATEAAITLEHAAALRWVEPVQQAACPMVAGYIIGLTSYQWIANGFLKFSDGHIIGFGSSQY